MTDRYTQSDLLPHSVFWKLTIITDRYKYKIS